MEAEENGELPFLDFLITHHPDSIVTRTLFSRALSLCSNVSAWSDEERHVSKSKVLRSNGCEVQVKDTSPDNGHSLIQNHQRPQS